MARGLGSYKTGRGCEAEREHGGGHELIPWGVAGLSGLAGLRGKGCEAEREHGGGHELIGSELRTGR